MLHQVNTVEDLRTLGGSFAKLPSAPTHLEGKEPSTIFDPLHWTRSEGVKPRGRRVRWEGTVSGMDSFSVVNQVMIKLLGNLVGSTIDTISVLDTNEDMSTRRLLPYTPPRHVHAVHDFMSNVVDVRTADLTIRNGWPINFNAPRTGLWVTYLAWEFYAIPTQWVRSLSMANEIWTPTLWVKQGLVASGLPAHKVHVIPHGVNKSAICPTARSATSNSTLLTQLRRDCGVPRRDTTTRPFVFLYHGGMLERKGTDLVVEAFARAFQGDAQTAPRRRAPICLVLHSTYGETALTTAVTNYVNTQSLNMQARMVLLQRHLNQTDLAALMSFADVLLHPSRSEGFGLGVAEAMTCGLPVITLGGGANADFVTADTAMLVHSKPITCRLNPCTSRKDNATGNTLYYVKGQLTPIAPVWLGFHPRDLAAVMLHVVQNPERMHQKAEAAMAKAASLFAWERVQELMARRLDALFRSNTLEERARRLRTSRVH